MEVSYVRIWNQLGKEVKIEDVDYTSSDWADCFKPAGLKGDTIADKAYHTETLKLKVGKTGKYILYFNCDGYQFSVVVTQGFHDRQYYKEQSTGSFGVIQSVSWEKSQNEGRGTQNIYLYNQVERYTDRVKFFVLSDTHISEDDDDNPACCSVKIRDHMMSQPDFPKHKYIFIPGDLLKDCTNKQDDRYCDIWQCADRKFSPLLCDGYGNTDMDIRFGSHCDVSELIRDRNKTRATALADKGFVTNTIPSCAADLHYTWKDTLNYNDGTEKKTLTIHFYMLNLKPASGCNDDRKQNASCSLEFLKEHLPTSKNEPIFLFHHYGFLYPVVNGYEEKYFFDDEVSLYLETIKDYPVAGIFYGHLHQTLDDQSLRAADYPNAAFGTIHSFCCGGVQGSCHHEYVQAEAFVIGSGSYRKLRVSVIGWNAYDITKHSINTEYDIDIPE